MDNVTIALARYMAVCKSFLDMHATGDYKEVVTQLPQLKSNWKITIKELLALSDQQNPCVWLALGGMFEKGWGTVRDPVAAIRWYRQGADAGHVPSMVRLAHGLQNQGSTTDAEAMMWFQKAADGGSTSAMVSLGFIYRDGKGVEPDVTEAERWFSLAVEAGDLHSVVHLGRTFRNFNLSAKAVTWFQIAIQAGFVEGYIELADLYDNRKSEIYDPEEAVKWYQAAAGYNNPSAYRAMYNLACHYRDGKGVSRNAQKSCEWLSKVVAGDSSKWSGYSRAKRMLETMRKELQSHNMAGGLTG